MSSGDLLGHEEVEHLYLAQGTSVWIGYTNILRSGASLTTLTRWRHVSDPRHGSSSPYSFSITAVTAITKICPSPPPNSLYTQGENKLVRVTNSV